MSVLPFHRPDNEPTLIALAPEGYVRCDAYMGLLETIAWVGSRDTRLSAAAYWYLHEREDRRRDDSFPLWYLLWQDLADHYNARVKDAEAEVMAAGLEAVGRFQGGGFEVMAPLLWVDVQLAFDDVPDSIRPKDIRNNLGKPLWSHIRFKRGDVLKRWPDEAAPPAVGLAEPDVPPKATRAELQEWVRERIRADESQSAVCAAFKGAVPGKRVDLNREQVRDIYRAEFAALKGQAVRPGPRVID